MNIRPIGNKILIRIKPETETVAGGIVIPGRQRSQTRTGIVQALPSAYRGDLAVGDEVAVPAFGGSGTEITVNGSRLLFINAGDIAAALE